MKNKLSADQFASALFVLGLAALAMFDFWFPGILLVMGGTAMAWAHAAHQPRSRVGWGLVAVGCVFWLYDVLPPAWFPVVMIALAVLLVFGVDLRQQLSRRL